MTEAVHKQNGMRERPKDCRAVRITVSGVVRLDIPSTRSLTRDLEERTWVMDGFEISAYVKIREKIQQEYLDICRWAVTGWEMVPM